jgi:hypothetical protein
MSWRTAVNQSVGVARIADARQYVGPDNRAATSPIDVFYRASQDILRVGTPQFLIQHPSMGPLMLVGLVSATENYFRDVFARIIRVCPTAQSKSADQSVKLGSVIWHSGGDLERGAFEHISFADADKLVKASRDFLGFNLRQPALLDEFDKVCELRHGIVHSGAIIAGKNAIRLQLPPASEALRISVEFAQLQECGNVCTTLVASLNTDLFIEMARRWAVVWPKLPSWDQANSHALFKEVWHTFFSTFDQANGAIPTDLSLMRCKNQVASEYS